MRSACNNRRPIPCSRDRLLEEAKWGLAWVLKTSFGDGYRSTGQLISYWTNGIMGDADDRFGQAVNDPEWNFRVSADEALAARVLKRHRSRIGESQPRNGQRRLEIRSRRLEEALQLAPKSTGRRTSWNSSLLAPSHPSNFISSHGRKAIR